MNERLLERAEVSDISRRRFLRDAASLATAACLREHALNPKPIYLQAARDALGRIRAA